MPGVVGVGRAPLAHAPLVFFRIAVLDRLLRAIPTPVAGQLTGVAALGFRAALLIAKVPRVGHIQLLAEPAFTSPSPLPRILCFHGGRSSTKPVRSKRSKCSESRGGRRRKKIFHSKLSEEDPEEETSISGPVNLCHLQNGGGNARHSAVRHAPLHPQILRRRPFSPGPNFAAGAAIHADSGIFSWPIAADQGLGPSVI